MVAESCTPRFLVERLVYLETQRPTTLSRKQSSVIAVARRWQLTTVVKPGVNGCTGCTGVSRTGTVGQEPPVATGGLPQSRRVQGGCDPTASPPAVGARGKSAHPRARRRPGVQVIPPLKRPLVFGARFGRCRSGLRHLAGRRYGVTAEFGCLTDHFGDVTDGRLVPARRRSPACRGGRTRTPTCRCCSYR